MQEIGNVEYTHYGNYSAVDSTYECQKCVGKKQEKTNKGD